MKIILHHTANNKKCQEQKVGAAINITLQIRTNKEKQDDICLVYVLTFSVLRYPLCGFNH